MPQEEDEDGSTEEEPPGESTMDGDSPAGSPAPQQQPGSGGVAAGECGLKFGFGKLHDKLSSSYTIPQCRHCQFVKNAISKTKWIQSLIPLGLWSAGTPTKGKPKANVQPKGKGAVVGDVVIDEVRLLTTHPDVQIQRRTSSAVIDEVRHSTWQASTVLDHSASSSVALAKICSLSDCSVPVCNFIAAWHCRHREELQPMLPCAMLQARICCC